ncbi:hypothetical protein, partial [uncultured Shewanella sp.]|uniref:hypothetical protein n=1 Tax=uncultured Shewanella sp. TaxID=173975 RepID=UPI0026363B66
MTLIVSDLALVNANLKKGPINRAVIAGCELRKKEINAYGCKSRGNDNGKRQKAKGKRQKAKGKRQKAKGKRQ